ncbi:orotidine-5'-phosphate decarboxylase [Actinomycetes bacterium NPDC127524]
MENPLIIALDFPDAKKVKEFLSDFRDSGLFLKVGMELYYQNGPSIIYTLKELGHKVFLDLKLHDIPNTVKSAMKGLASLEPDIVNVHAAGGKRMMESALEGLDAGTGAGKKRPMCIGVTQLTSTSQLQMQNEQLIKETLDASVLHYAKLVSDSGLDGAVCSIHEVERIHEHLGTGFFTVAPGIRVKENDIHDQNRVATPEQARSAGADAIVCGRAITGSADPAQAYKTILKAWKGTRV